MEKKIYNTLVKRSERLGGNKYAWGVINGMARVMTNSVETLINGDAIALANYKDKKGNCIMIVRCTAEEYENLTKVIEATYPGLCEFDYRIED